MKIGGQCVKECKGCPHTVEHFCRTFCTRYRYPDVWWKHSGCPFNTEVEVKSTQKIRVGQQKQRKQW